jgi:3-deoxy-D-manno-octulosonate 8-phosphate phosphatase KdsC-like HAD superfamily phosphatase
VEHHPSTTSEDGYSLEVFNALGDTLAVVTVRESEIETLKAS